MSSRRLSPQDVRMKWGTRPRPSQGHSVRMQMHAELLNSVLDFKSLIFFAKRKRRKKAEKKQKSENGSVFSFGRLGLSGVTSQSMKLQVERA